MCSYFRIAGDLRNNGHFFANWPKTWPMPIRSYALQSLVKPAHLKFSRSNVANLAGKTSLTDVFNLIKHCDLVVANDSAPMHIAAAMQRRIVPLFGPTNFLGYGPYPLDCDRHTVLSKCNLADLAVGDVFNACAAQIDNFLHSH